MVGGLSRRGSAAAFIALLHPNLSGNVLSQSGWLAEGDGKAVKWEAGESEVADQILHRRRLVRGRFPRGTNWRDRESALLWKSSMTKVTR